MAYIIVKPADTSDPNYDTELATYNARLDSARLRASPDLIARITETELPESVIADDAYLLASEIKVLRDTGIAASAVSGLSADRFELLLLALWDQMSIELIPQIAAILRQRSISTETTVAEVDWEKRVARIEKRYAENVTVLNPSANVSSDASATVEITTSRDYL